MQNYLGFQLVNIHFKMIANTDDISAWKSTRLYNESINPTAASNNNLALSLNHTNTKLQLKLKQPIFEAR